jgi:hypothetical protein
MIRTSLSKASNLLKGKHINGLLIKASNLINYTNERDNVTGLMKASFQSHSLPTAHQMT